MKRATIISTLKNLCTEAHNLFLVIAIPAILFMLAILPPGWGLDEPMHAARAYQISNLDWYPNTLGKYTYGGEISKSLIDAVTHGHKVSNNVNMNAIFLDRKDDPNPVLTETLSNHSIKGEPVVYNFGPTGPYSPVPYLPSALGFGIGRVLGLSVGTTVFLARLFQAAVFVLLVYVGLRFMQAHKAKWLMFIIALLPVVVYQAVTLTADAYTTGAVLLFSGVVYTLFNRKTVMSRRELVWLSVSSMLLMFTKPSYALLILLVGLLPKRLFRNKKAHILIKSGVLIAGFICLLVVSLIGLRYGDSILVYKDATVVDSIGLSDQLIYILSHPMNFIMTLITTVTTYQSWWGVGMIGTLGYNAISAPFGLLVLAYVALVITSLDKDKGFSKVVAVWSIIVSALAALSILVLLYGTFNQVGHERIEGVQGRYFVPLLFFLLIGIGRLLPITVKIKSTVAPWLHGCVSLLVLYTTFLIYYVALV